MTTSNILACKILNKPIIISERTNYDFLSSKIRKIVIIWLFNQILLKMFLL